MKVLHLNTYGSGGGAAVAASRLVAAERGLGVDAELCVRRGRLSFVVDRLGVLVGTGFRRDVLWSVDTGCCGEDVTGWDAFRRADVVHLHWVNQGFVSLDCLRAILTCGKPVVWTLHDMWPVTGVCHHAGECEGYVGGCGVGVRCPLLCGDWAGRVWRAKREMMARAEHLTFVAVSEWMAERARRSGLVGGHEVRVIPNGLPMDVFRGRDRVAARRELGLPVDSRIVAFGAARIDEPGKGLVRLIEALRIIDKLTSREGGRLHLLLFGGCKDVGVLSDVPCDYTYMGRVGDVDRLALLYSAADVVVSASEYETFGQTLAEGQACGCVPVSFDRGGQRDIINHLRDGYLARYGDVEDLAAGIIWALGDGPSGDVLRSSAMRFSDAVVAKEYLGVYEQRKNTEKNGKTRK